MWRSIYVLFGLGLTDRTTFLTKQFLFRRLFVDYSSYVFAMTGLYLYQRQSRIPQITHINRDCVVRNIVRTKNVIAKKEKYCVLSTVLKFFSLLELSKYSLSHWYAYLLTHKVKIIALFIKNIIMCSTLTSEVCNIT